MNKLIIKHINITNFRQIKNMYLEFSSKFNLIDGQNGLGKTSILDAIRYIFFIKNSDGNMADNYKSLNDDNKLPNIELVFEYKNKEYKLLTKNNKWFINGSEYKKSDDYIKRILEIFNLNDIKELFLRSNPHILTKIILSNSNDKKEFKDEFISIINLGLDEDTKIQNFSEIVEKRNDLSLLIKDLKKKVKTSSLEIENYKISHPEIKNWDIINDNNTSDAMINLKNQIDLYEEIADQIQITSNKIKNLQIDIDNLSSIEINLKDDKKPSLFKIIFLSIITFGIYYFVYKKRNKRCSNPNNENDSLTNNEYKIKTLKENLMNENIRLNKLLNHENYKNVDYEKLVNIKRELINQNNNNSEFNSYKLTHKDMLNKLKLIEDDLYNKNNEYIKINNEYINSSKKIEEYVKNNFKEFDVLLFDENGSDKFLISQNGIDIKYLNFANKNNIVHLLNQFIKRGIEINCFNLIDQVESFNNLYLKDYDSQIICCRVTNDKELMLNGKNIN